MRSFTEVVSGFPYTSARLRSANKFDFQYGKAEVRAKAAMGGGLWSADATDGHLRHLGG